MSHSSRGCVSRRNILMLLLASSACLQAAPVLRLITSANFVRVAPGANTSALNFAYNIGDGALSLTVSVDRSAPWLIASVGQTQDCGYSHICFPLNFALQTANLAVGTYTAQVTVSDPLAIDAPQVITVTVQVGDMPIAVDQYIAPGSKSDLPVDIHGGGFCCPPSQFATTSTQDGGHWLSLSYSFQIEFTIAFVSSWFIELAPSPTMLPGAYHGTFSIINTDQNRDIPVTMRVTTQPIAVPSMDHLTVRLAQNGPAASYPFLSAISFRNSGIGTLVMQDIAGSGTGVSAYNIQGSAIITVDPGSLVPGLYNDGIVTIQCNAANCPLQIPVSLEIVPQGPPVIAYRSVVDNATFDPNNPVAQGGIAIVKGELLSLQSPQFASSSSPLPTTLGGATVLINGSHAPLYYTSYGQIAFQMPSNAKIGQDIVEVVRDGQTSNAVLVTVAPTAPQIVAVTDTAYNRIDLNHRAKPGDTIVVWAIGLGPTNPVVPDGAPAPYPPANVNTAPIVQLGPVGETVGAAIFKLTSSFAGLSPGSVGLYQVNVTLPAGIPSGSFPLWFGPSGAPVPLAIN